MIGARGWIVDDAARLRTLKEFGRPDTPAEERFDVLARAAAAIADAPVALVSLVERDRQWFKAKVGTDIPETPISSAICVHTLEQGGALVIPDLAADPRTAANPLVTGEPFVRFYAGFPMVIDGQAIGTVCVLDVKPRPDGLSDDQRHELTRLANRAAGLFADAPPVG